MTRNRWLTASVIVAVIIALLIYGLLWWQSRASGVGEREPIPALAYCNSNDARPCIASFSLDPDGKMLVNVVTPGLSFPAFYLQIIHSEGENVYECEKLERFSTSFYCLGEAMRLGEVLQFLDRKSTRLNSSHLVISYAVFCLKKKNNRFNMIIA